MPAESVGEGIGLSLEQATVGIVGLGYVGLPLAVEFSKVWPVVGFDISATRVDQLQNGIDVTLEVSSNELRSAGQITYTRDLSDLKRCNVFIVSVPTPVDEFKRPDMSLVLSATAAVGTVLKKGDVVVYESTVYPGATEDDCVPILERESGLVFNEDFFVGYSPERINPGDKNHKLTNIVKVTSGSTPEVADFVDQIYSRIIRAGTHKARTIKVAEAAKVIENIQRDVNIALMNELAIIFHLMGIDTMEVLEASGTKWNFLPFRPGLVGGHCIGVDPYYLTHKAQAYGYHPEVILAGRRINDSIGDHIADRLVKLMLKKGINVLKARILIMGFTFKENCPDLRNTRVVDIVEALTQYNALVDIYDPWVDPHEVMAEYGLGCLSEVPTQAEYDAVVIAVAHSQFAVLGHEGIAAMGKPNAVIFDVKSILPPGTADGRL